VEQSVLKIVDAILALGGLPAAIALAASAVAFYFYRQSCAREAEMRALLRERLADVRSVTALVTEVNGTLKAAASVSEARDAAVRQLVDVVIALKSAFDAHREITNAVSARVESALADLQRRR